MCVRESARRRRSTDARARKSIYTVFILGLVRDWRNDQHHGGHKASFPNRSELPLLGCVLVPFLGLTPQRQRAVT